MKTITAIILSCVVFIWVVIQGVAYGYSINITAENGSVVKYPDKESYASGETVELISRPDCGYRFANWSGDIRSDSLVVEVTVQSDLNVTANFQTWTPPIGVPDPGFGIFDQRPARPGDWSSEIPGYYYVNYETGSDSHTYGTPASPRRTIPSPVPAGSYVEIHGSYSHSETIESQGSGDTWQAGVSGPVWIVGENAANRPTITATFAIRGSWIYLEQLYFSYPYGKIVVGGTSNADHVVIRNCEVEGDHATRSTGVNVGVYRDYLPAFNVNNVVIYNNHLFGFGDLQTTADQDSTPMTVGSGTDHIWVVDNYMHSATGSVRAGGAYDDELPQWAHHIYLGRNILHSMHEALLWLKMGQDVIMSQNHLYKPINRADILRENGQPVPDDYEYDYSMCMGAQYRPRRLWLLYNEMHDATYGVRVTSTSGEEAWNVHVIGNLIYNIHPHPEKEYNPESTWSEAAIHIQGNNSNHDYIVNNTIYNAVAGIHLSGGGYFSIENNVIANIDSDSYFLSAENNLDRKSVQYNFFYNPEDGAVRFKWGSSTRYANLADFQNAVGTVQNCSQADPRFLVPELYDFALRSDSPLIDSGVESAIYQTYRDRYGVDISKDIKGLARPQAGLWDVGACEYDKNSPPEPYDGPGNSDSSGDAPASRSSSGGGCFIQVSSCI